MAREKAGSTGGKALAAKVLVFITKNKTDMKTGSTNREASQNEQIGDEDLANAIAYAVEQALADQTVLIDAKAGLAGGPAAVGAPIPVSPIAPLNLPTASVKNLIYKS